jgi:large subunit ribosomal protein L23
LSQASPVNSALPHTPTGPGPAQRFPLKLESEFQALRLKGQFKGDEASARKAFLKGQVAWRSRIRGVSKKKEKSILRGLREDGIVEEQEGEGEETFVETEGEIVGQRIYLPNVQIRLMRNNTPAGQAYDPTIATFRIPPSMTKTDLRSYLHTVYNLPVTFIRTDLYQPPVMRIVGGNQVRQSGSVKNYKRAVVGLVEPFHYPDDVEELRAKGEEAGVGDQWSQAREDWLNEKFQKDRMDDNMKRARFKLYKGYRWRSRWHDNEVGHVSTRLEFIADTPGQHRARYHGQEERKGIKDSSGSREGPLRASCIYSGLIVAYGTYHAITSHHQASHIILSHALLHKLDLCHDKRRDGSDLQLSFIALN